MAILVTGGAGMIGSHLVRSLLEQGHSVHVVDNLCRGKLSYLPISERDLEVTVLDLRDRVAAEKAVQGADEVYHLASVNAGISWLRKNQASTAISCSQINSNVLKACMDKGVRKFLFTSSACMYPEQYQRTPGAPCLREDMDKPLGPDSMYGWAKAFMEMELAHAREENGFPSAVIRMFNVYGPHEDYSADSHVLPSLCRKAILYPKEPFTVWGDGNQTRAFLYVEDCVEALILAMERGMDVGPINIGNPVRISIGDLAGEILKFSGKQPQIQHDLARDVGVIGRAPDITKATKLLGWSPTTKLCDGLMFTYRWIEEQIVKKSMENGQK